MPILIPVELQKAMRELPPVAQFEESTPIPPPPSPEPVNIWQGAIAIIILMVVVGLIGSFINSGLTVLPLILGLGLIIGRMQIQYMTYKTRLRDHTALTEAYFLLLTTYSRKQSEYEQDIALTRTSDRLKEFRQAKILEILSKTNDKIAQKSLVGDKLINFEDRSPFAIGLKSSLGDRTSKDNLQQGITIQIPGFNYVFIPDFTYIDASTNLHISISVIVPSDKSNKEYEDICNSFLLKSGWIICNFNSTEVAENPDRCIHAITDLIDELI
jgi:hypothetical protein